MLLTEPLYLFSLNLLFGAVLGHVLYRSDFCMAGMFRDIFLFRRGRLLPSLALLIACAMALFALAKTAGLITFSPPPTYRHPSLSTAIGGTIFGMGMVLAGGCVVSTLYRMAAGSLAALLAFSGIIVGSLLYAEFHPFWTAIKDATSILNYSTLQPYQGPFIPFAISLALAALVLGSALRGKLTTTAYASAYLQPWKAAIAIAVLNFVFYVFSGWPMGITTAYAKIGAYIERMIAPDHVEKLPYFSEDSVSVVVAGRRISGGPGPRIDIITFTELTLAAGVFIGAMATSVRLREFRISGLPPLRQVVSAFVGGAFVGYGARVAGGCNLKFIAGGLPLLALEGVIFTAGLLGGAYLGTLILKRLVIRM